MNSVDYESIYPGEVFRSKFTITSELVKKYVKAIEGTEKFDRVPKYLFAMYTPVYEALGGRLAPGTLHLREKVEYYHESNVGDEIEVTVTIKEKYEKNNKDYLIIEINYSEGDVLICKHVSTHLWKVF